MRSSDLTAQDELRASEEKRPLWDMACSETPPVAASTGGDVDAFDRRRRAVAGDECSNSASMLTDKPSNTCCSVRRWTLWSVWGHAGTERTPAALCSDWLPKQRVLTGEDVILELVARYAISHGSNEPEDMAGWSIIVRVPTAD